MRNSPAHRVATRWLRGHGPGIGFHVSKSKNESAISHKGFKPDSAGRRYFWDTYAMANWFAQFQNDDRSPMTIYKVRLDGLPLKKDTETDDMGEWGSSFERGYDGGGWFTTSPVGPERIMDKSRT